MDEVMESLLKGAAIAAIRLSRTPETVAEFESYILSIYGGLDDAHQATLDKVMALALSEARARRPLGVATCLDEIRRLRTAHAEILGHPRR